MKLVTVADGASGPRRPLPYLAAFLAVIALMLSGLSPAVQADDQQVVQMNEPPTALLTSDSEASNAPPGFLVSKVIEGGVYPQFAIFSDPGDTLTVTSLTHNQVDGVVHDLSHSSGRVWFELESLDDILDIEPALTSPLITTISITVQDSGGNSVSTSYKYKTAWGTED